MAHLQAATNDSGRKGLVRAGRSRQPAPAALAATPGDRRGILLALGLGILAVIAVRLLLPPGLHPAGATPDEYARWAHHLADRPPLRRRLPAGLLRTCPSW